MKLSVRQRTDPKQSWQKKMKGAVGERLQITQTKYPYSSRGGKKVIRTKKRSAGCGDKNLKGGVLGVFCAMSRLFLMKKTFPVQTQCLVKKTRRGKSEAWGKKQPPLKRGKKKRGNIPRGTINQSVELCRNEGKEGRYCCSRSVAGGREMGYPSQNNEGKTGGRKPINAGNKYPLRALPMSPLPQGKLGGKQERKSFFDLNKSD